MPREERIRQEINPQLWMLNAVNRAIRIRQEESSKFSSAVAGAWCSLFPRMKESLVQKLDELIPDLTAKDIRDYNKDGFETSYDLFDCIKDKFKGKGGSKKIKASEILLTQIMEVMQESGILGTKREMPTTMMRRRTLQKSSEDDENGSE